MLNRAPTLHRLGIQAFQPKLIEGKAIQLHPLVCTAFNADFDGDQMAIHVPLGHAAILEAQLLMLAAHNILNPANGAPIAVPSQDMVLGLYYMTKARKNTPEYPVKGEGMTFYSPEEITVAYNEGIVDLHAIINVRISDPDGTGDENDVRLTETTVGRVIFNQYVPKGFGFINELLTKKSLRDIIGTVLEKTDNMVTAKFLDDIKSLGYRNAYDGGLSFNLGDILIPEIKEQLISDANEKVDEVTQNYNMGFITNNERYNQIIDIWTHTNSRLTDTLMKEISSDRQGFNAVYMMLDSGARGSKEQIRQLSGMRGLMAKPQKSSAAGAEIIENPILSNFKEGLTILEYFISTHGARKGLADTALKTANSGYLTRRLVDVAQDMVVLMDDCGTDKGLFMRPIIEGGDVVEPLGERVLGRVTAVDVLNLNEEVVIPAKTLMDEDWVSQLDELGVDEILVRSAVTCEADHGVCAHCYGRDLGRGHLVNVGEAAGVIAAQSIGEPGTQLTMRTFHIGGAASRTAAASNIVVKSAGIVRMVNIKTVVNKDNNLVAVSRSGELAVVDGQGRVREKYKIP